MIEQILEYSQKKDFRAYAWELYSGYANGTVTMKDLMDLLALIYQKELEYENDDTEEEEVDDFWGFSSDGSSEYFDPCRIYGISGFYAFALLRKGLLDRRWTFENEVYTCGEYTVSMKEINETYAAIAEQAGGNPDWADNWFKKILSIEPKDDAFWLAPLDHCTEENALVVLTILKEIYEYALISLERLRGHQYIWPEKYLRDDLVEEVTKRSYKTSYCRDFMSTSSYEENETAVAADNKFRNARTIAEAVFAETEFEFWMQFNPYFTYSAYVYLTGLEEDREFPESLNMLIDFSQDPTLAEEAQHILAEAIAGDPTAQDTLSQMYIAGQDVAKDEYRAVYWMKKAADQGVANAQCNYGVALQEGMGQAQIDPAEAIQWFLKAAEQNQAVAQYNLGMAYFNGKGVPRDWDAAREWLQKAADNGYDMARLILNSF